MTFNTITNLLNFVIFTCVVDTYNPVSTHMASCVLARHAQTTATTRPRTTEDKTPTATLSPSVLRLSRGDPHTLYLSPPRSCAHSRLCGAACHITSKLMSLHRSTVMSWRLVFSEPMYETVSLNVISSA